MAADRVQLALREQGSQRQENSAPRIGMRDAGKADGDIHDELLSRLEVEGANDAGSHQCAYGQVGNICASSKRHAPFVAALLPFAFQNLNAVSILFDLAAPNVPQSFSIRIRRAACANDPARLLRLNSASQS